MVVNISDIYCINSKMTVAQQLNHYKSIMDLANNLLTNFTDEANYTIKTTEDSIPIIPVQ